MDSKYPKNVGKTHRAFSLRAAKQLPTATQNRRYGFATLSPTRTLRLFALFGGEKPARFCLCRG
ncbi:hypothetical protein [Photorhabdus hainanensis]|uniref:hypothetical protein n=1 Tax=Photorhabdus hainanensis TaxID=1004166 RepID=UPI0030EB4705